MLVRLVEKGRPLRPGPSGAGLGPAAQSRRNNNPEWKTVAIDETSGNLVAPNGAIGHRWGEQGKWNLEEKTKGRDVKLKMSLILDGDHDEVAQVAFPLFRQSRA